MKRVMAALLLLALGGGALAADVVEGVWSGEAELGYVQTSGNTETTTINVRAAAALRHAAWLHDFEFTGLRATDGGVTTADSVSLLYRAEYNLSDIDALFGSLRGEDNRFAGFDRRYTEVLGYRRSVIRTDSHTLKLEAGIGARQTRNVDGTRTSEGILRAAMDYAWQITESSSFKQAISMENGSDNRVTESVTELKLKINGNLSMKTTLTVKNNSTVPPGVRNTDVQTAVTLVYDF